MEGYVKLYRSIMDWEWWNDHNTMRLWIALLAMANWKPGDFKGQKVERGQLVTSISKLAKVTTLSERNVRSSILHLKSTGEITVKTTNKYSLITIVNYDKFQSRDAETDKQSDTQGAKQVTDNRQASDKCLTTIEERKKSKNEKNCYSSTDQDEFQQRLKSWRKERGLPEEREVDALV